MSTVAVASEPSILSLRLIPFDKPQLVGDVVGDRTVIYFERWDKSSFDSLPSRIPLLRGHDVRAPVGWVESLWKRDDGLDGEARLVGSPEEIRNLTALIGADLLSGASIGFSPDGKRDVWSRGGRNDRPPQVTRRGARIHEASLVLEAAYRDARVTEVRGLTVAEAERREAHRKVDDEFRQYKLDRKAETRKLLRDAELLVANADARTAELAARLRTTTPVSTAVDTRRPMLDTDVIGVTSRSGPGHWVTWGDATPEQRELYVRTGTIQPDYS